MRLMPSWKIMGKGRIHQPLAHAPLRMTLCKQDVGICLQNGSGETAESGESGRNTAHAAEYARISHPCKHLYIKTM